MDIFIKLCIQLRTDKSVLKNECNTNKKNLYNVTNVKKIINKK